jgi:predicted acetyltransferase
VDLEIRPVTSDEAEAFGRASALAFGAPFDAERFARSQPLVDLARTLAAFDPGAAPLHGGIVATAHSHAFDVSVPGADGPAAGVANVTVRPTHRRRGLLTTLMRRQLDDVHGRGEPLACLWASEAPIYRRFGYGLATRGLRWQLDRPGTGFAPGLDAGALEARLVAPADARSALADLHERTRATTPAMVKRTDGWWDRILHNAKGDTLAVVVEGAGQPEAAGLYSITPSWATAGPANTLSANEVYAVTPQAYAAVWRYLLDVDLVGRVTTFHRPLDEPLQWLLTDPRAMQPALVEGLWARLVDVGPALAGRRYSAEAHLAFDVTDRFCPWNEGRWRLDAGPDGATCERAGSSQPDLHLDVADLGASYFGLAVFGSLQRAGLVDEARPGAIREADRAFDWSPAPWAVTFF